MEIIDIYRIIWYIHGEERNEQQNKFSFSPCNLKKTGYNRSVNICSEQIFAFIVKGCFIMILSVVSVIAMGIMFIVMIRKASFKSTRKLALLPLTACLMEMIATGVLHPAQFPLVTGLLVFLRISILFCCAGALRWDLLARKKQRMKAAAANRRQVLTFVGKLSTTSDKRVRCA